MTTHGSVEGWVDGWQDGAVRGWAWCPDLPGQRVAIELLDGDRVVASGIASHYRGDLVGLGKAAGMCGFALRPALQPGAIAVGGVLALTVRVADGATLPGVAIALTEADLAAAAAAAQRPSSVPMALNDGHGTNGFLEEFGPDRILGWACRPANPSPHLAFEIVADGAVIARFTADYWRGDLAAVRQGDGRWAFAAAFPPELRTGRLHSVVLRLADTGLPITPEPIRVQFSANPRPPVPLRLAEGDDTRSRRTRPPRDDVPDDIFLSVVVVFHNMQREAARTLASLSRAYQQSIGALRYEVLCVDNFSRTPLDAAWVENFGPEFRLLRPSQNLPSPCFAINEAASQAKGRYIAVMIDGAHVLTPGVLRETWDALTEAPEAVLGLRQYFIGGDQRWLAQIGYGPAQEDMLFDRIGWPHDGYGLFGIGGPVYENGSGWLGSMSESNFLVIPRPIWTSIGGMDERFAEPGAGFANLDLFSRAAAASPEPVIALVGEASFHQYHGGTTTNVEDDEKDRRVRAYEQHYVQVARARHVGAGNVDLRLRGQLRTDRAARNRQRPPSPAKIGVTTRVRPANLPVHFDEQAVEYLTAIYAETGLHETALWRGQSLGVAPADALSIQEIIHEQRPDCILAVNAAPGMLTLLADLCRLDGLAARVIAAGGQPSQAVHHLPGDADNAAISAAIGAAARVLVLVQPAAGDELPLETLRRFASFVTIRSYLIVLGTAFGQPWLGYSRNWYKTAVQLLLDGGNFAIDEGRTRHIVTTCPLGFLQRTGPVVSYSESII